MIRIVRVGSPITTGAHRQYCGRAGKGESGHLGNPFWMNNESERDSACDKFQEHFDIMMKNKEGNLYNATKSLYKIAKEQDVELACFCTPKRCHCETIKSFLEKFL